MGNFSLSRSRIGILIVLTLGLLTLFTLRLVDIQVVQADAYALRAAQEMSTISIMPAPRGTITDINGVELARSVAAINVVVDQTLISDPKKFSEIAAPILSMSVSDVVAQVSGKRRWSLVARNVTPATWIALKDAFAAYNDGLSRQDVSKRLFGFYAERGYTREYPSGSLIASLIGFVNQAGVGAAGLESSMNSQLTGTEGKYSYANGYGAEIPGSQQELVSAKTGTTLRLTIDRDIQWVASQAIEQAVKTSRAISGSVIVMDPKTGNILAHATAPTYDPNDTRNVPLSLMRNPSVQDVYEPGSTGKVMTLSAAIEEGAITPSTVFTIPDAFKVSNRTFRDHEKHPTERLTATGILAESSNVGAIKIGQKLKNSVLYSYLRKFGVGTNTGSGLPGESQGVLSDVANWSGTTAPTVAFGQGYSVTAMQATSIFATIANDGIRVSPTVIAGTSDSDGHFTPAKFRDSVRVISSSTASDLRLMMESVVSVQGTAPEAAIPGYRVAGKTGTAQRVDETCGCYRGYTASFIGFAPADKPRYVINVTIQAPQGIHWGGTLGGPVFKKVMSFVLQSRHVPPTGTKVIPYPLNESQVKKFQLLLAKSREVKK
ncbi:MAG: penicillin-binding protein 2 [Candidatus Nanopelagicaceae bacterium]|nr:penicillin-binding protein 2 [Candidatus Nanopelagicaceae bacterium]